MVFLCGLPNEVLALEPASPVQTAQDPHVTA